MSPLCTLLSRGVESNGALFTPALDDLRACSLVEELKHSSDAGLLKGVVVSRVGFALDQVDPGVFEELLICLGPSSVSAVALKVAE